MSATFTAQVQPTPSSVPTPTPPLMEGGLMVAIVVYLIKEGVGFFKQKDASEEKLMAMLIEDLRAERSQQLQQVITALSQVGASQNQIAAAIQTMSKAISDINLASQQNARIHSEIFAQLRNQEKILLSLDERMQSQSPAIRANGFSLERPSS